MAVQKDEAGFQQAQEMIGENQYVKESDLGRSQPSQTTNKSSKDLTVRLYAAWERAVANNQLINEFEAVADDADGRWVKGDAIAFGIKRRDDQNIYYAQNLTQSREIQGAVEEKHIDGLNFICQFNGYRALRPGGELKPSGRQPDISPAPECCRFSCQDSRDPLSLLARQPLLQRSLAHFTWKAYYNAAPIDPDGHFLWIPTASDSSASLSHFPQRLSLEFLADAFSLFKQLQNTLLFFNSLHSGASVNHIHFQAINYRRPLPVEAWPLSTPEASDYATLKDYPARVMVFDQGASAHQVFAWIDRLQQRCIPFNLMFVGTRIMLIPRRSEHEIVSEFPGNGIAALGMCGKIITVNRLAYVNASKETIESAFAKMVPALPFD